MPDFLDLSSYSGFLCSAEEGVYIVLLEEYLLLHGLLRLRVLLLLHGGRLLQKHLQTLRYLERWRLLLNLSARSRRAVRPVYSGGGVVEAQLVLEEKEVVVVLQVVLELLLKRVVLKRYLGIQLHQRLLVTVLRLLNWRCRGFKLLIGCPSTLNNKHLLSEGCKILRQAN